MNGQHENPQPTPDGDQEAEKSSMIQRVERHILRRMMSGLFVLIPLIITLWVLYFVLGKLDSFVRSVSKTAQLDVLDQPFVGVVIALGVLYVIGAIVSNKSGRRAFDWQSAVLTRIPVVKSIYGVAKQAADALSTPMGHQYSRVVLINWPRPGVLAMGFVTGHLHYTATDSTHLVVYIPTVPNPTSGNLAIVPESEIIETDMTIEDAMKIVFSGGIVLPDSLSIREQPWVTQTPGD